MSAACRLATMLLVTGLAAPLLAQSGADRLVEARTVRDGGDHAGALRIYAPLLGDADPEVRAVALEGSALILSWQGEYDRSIADYRTLAELSPTKHRDAVYGAARVLGWARRHEEGLRELQPLVDAHPDDKQIRMLEGQIAGWGGFTGRSVRAFRKVIQLDPGDDDARLGLAKVLAWGGRLAESQHEFEELLDRRPGHEAARIGVAYAFLWQGRPHEAQRHFDLIGAEHASSKEYKVLQVALEWALMQRAQSVAHQEALMRELPGEPDVRDLWRSQSGVIGHNVRDDATYLHDNEGLGVTTASLGGSLRLRDPGFLFGDYRKEWLAQDGASEDAPRDEIGVDGGRLGLDWALGRVALRGSLGARTSSVDTGGAVFGLGLRTLVRPNLGIALTLDSDYAFFTPRAVRSDVRMTGLSLGLSKSLGARLGLTTGFARTHFEGPAVEQDRDLVNAALRFQAGGFGGDYGNVRVDLGARGTYFRFDRQYADVGYWNPRRFRQVMGQAGGTYRKGEELTVIASAALGVQSQDDRDWETAAYLYAEALRQVGRRTDLWVRADYSRSGFARSSGLATGYRAWTVAGGIVFRLGDRSPSADGPRGAALAEPGPVTFLPPQNQ